MTCFHLSQMFRSRWIFSVLSLVVVGAQGVRADTQHVSPKISLKEVVDAVRRNNPEISAAREKWNAQKARYNQARTWNSPLLEFERMNAPASKNPIGDATEKTIALSQEVPFPGVLGARSHVVRHELDQSKAAFLAKEQEIVAEAKKTYAMLYFSVHSLHIYEGSVSVMKQMADVAQSKYTVGKAAQGDVLKAHVELSKMLNMKLMLEQELETNTAMLNTLMDKDPGAVLGDPEDLATSLSRIDLSTLTARALADRPELFAAKAQVQRSQAMVRASRLEFLPELMFKYRQRTMMDEPDSHDVMMGLSIPLWFRRQLAMIKESQAERSMADAEFESMRNMTRFEVKKLATQVLTAQRLVDLYQSSVLPQAEQALNVMEAAYRSDKADFIDVLDAVRSLLNFRLEHYSHIAEVHMKVAELERVLGGNLEGEKQ